MFEGASKLDLQIEYMKSLSMALIACQPDLRQLLRYLLTLRNLLSDSCGIEGNEGHSE